MYEMKIFILCRTLKPLDDSNNMEFMVKQKFE